MIQRRSTFVACSLNNVLNYILILKKIFNWRRFNEPKIYIFSHDEDDDDDEDYDVDCILEYSFSLT